MPELKRVNKFWWPWQTEKIEAMLEGMAGQGWILIKTGGSCSTFTFEKRGPARIRYCVDYQRTEKPEYLTILDDAGWKLEYKGTGWYLWSKPYDGERPALLTDADSLIRRNKAILGTLAAASAAQMSLFVILSDDFRRMTPLAVGFMIAWGVMVAVLVGIVIGIAWNIRQLRRRGGGRMPS